MKKILPLLEKNVQWIALGLGVLFLLYVLWTDLYNNPAAKSVTLRQGAVMVTPGTVDALIADDVERSLQPKLRAPHPDFRVDVKFPPPVSLAAVPATQPDTAVAWDSWGFDIGTKIQAANNNPQGNLVQALPVLPPLRYVDQETLRTVLSTPAGNKDADAVTTFWAFPAAEVFKAYKTAYGSKIPDPNETIYFVQVVLTRQEQLGNGDWGADVVVSRPANFPAPPFPYPQPAGAEKNLEAIRTWMLVNQPWIVEPDFPRVAYNRADLQWQKLESWIPFRANQQYVDSLPVIAAPPVTPPPAANPPPKRANAPAPAAPGAFAGGVEVFPTDPSAAPVANAIAGSGIFDSGPRPQNGQNPAGPGNNPAAPPGAPPPPPVPALQLIPPLGGLTPAAEVAGQDFVIWCHDLTVQPGKNYRYKVRYTLFNSVYGQPNKASAQVAAAFGIDSPETGWSDTASVPMRTRFFASGRVDHGTVGFTVFTWHNGLWKQKDYKDASAVAPGDEIGTDEADAGNFITHYTFLESNRDDSYSDNVKYSLVVAPDTGGPAQVRDFQADSTSQDFKRLQKKVADQVPPTPVNPPSGS